MSSTLAPRVVLITRPTEIEGLLARHGTLNQAKFFLESRGQDIEETIDAGRVFEEAQKLLLSQVPSDWRMARVQRMDLDRFLFAPDDLVVVLGQDGLVANVAKYLQGQPVLGFDPAPGSNAGVLVRFAPKDGGALLRAAVAGETRMQERSMVQARLTAGPGLLALNELFIGHRSHQSARYEIQVGASKERQSSSGLIVSTGTGATGWTASIARERGAPLVLPEPTEAALAYFVREAWPGAQYGVSLTAGRLSQGESLRIVSHMEQGVLFGDGIEADCVTLGWGQPVEVFLAKQKLRLVVG